MPRKNQNVSFQPADDVAPFLDLLREEAKKTGDRGLLTAAINAALRLYLSNKDGIDLLRDKADHIRSRYRAIEKQIGSLLEERDIDSARNASAHPNAAQESKARDARPEKLKGPSRTKPSK